MKLETVSEKVILSSIAASVALSSSPTSIEAADSKIVIDDITFNPSERYSFGHTGIKVFTIQNKLLDYDLAISDEETGIFGVKTHAAIRQFQKMKKLQVDGVAGPETLAALFINKNIGEVEVEDHIMLTIQEGQFFRNGDKGDAVKEIQKKLIDAGYYHFEKDGIFGSRTTEAVKAYQKDNGLQIDGIIGEETYEHLSGVSITVENEIKAENNLSTTVFAADYDMEIPAPTIVETVKVVEKHDLNAVDYLRNGDRGQAVKDLQSLLRNKGYYNKRVDGSFGPNTEAAVRNYQLQNNLAVDGIAGKRTILHLKTAPIAQSTARSAAPPTQAPKTTAEPAPTKKAPASSNNVIDYAKNFIGTPYVWGGTTPSGFDCSGFLMYVYKNQGVKIPRTVADIWSYGKSVDSLQVGDLVFFETYKKGPSHAGIYLGNQQFIHAGSSTGVTISDMNISYWKSRYLGAKRIN
ncbi:peptidoglycan-binding protein [Anaerobacillus sp. CMMVII]|uniref:C40 family peptidase n=1 Tax=Anaerobacillus sp. CMMVII TaxID=2755588 RepID=UPI0021C4D6EC|nr:peptidoglycan-binding protein [Anaerobacillus sp. CMMVII]MCT8137951.1 peptidoglycan-binding protein [Anaerobacillus sp. CMMVII]